MKYQVGDCIRSFFIKGDVDGLTPGKLYEVIEICPGSPLEGFYIKDDRGNARYCLTYHDAYLKTEGSWEVCNYEANLKKILEE